MLSEWRNWSLESYKNVFSYMMNRNNCIWCTWNILRAIPGENHSESLAKTIPFRMDSSSLMMGSISYCKQSSIHLDLTEDFYKKMWRNNKKPFLTLLLLQCGKDTHRLTNCFFVCPSIDWCWSFHLFEVGYDL